MSGRDLPQARLPKEQFLRLIRAASGVEVVWYTAERPQLGQEPGGEWAWIEVAVSGIEDVGWDEQRVQPNTATVPPTQDTITIGRRHCTLNLMAYSVDPEIEAFDLLERVRFAFNRQTVHDIMSPNMSLRWCERIVTLPPTQAKQDGRAMLRANMDIQMNYSVGADAGNQGTKGYVLSTTVAGGTLEE